MQTKALRSHRLLEEDVHTAARQAGKGSLDGVAAVILQQDGSLGTSGSAVWSTMMPLCFFDADW